MIAFLQDHGHAAPHAEHAPPDSIFTPLWHKVKDTDFGHSMGFDTAKGHLGMYWFEAIGFSLKHATPASRTARLTGPWSGAGVRLNTPSSDSERSISSASR